jgi:hypothetical protein
MHASTAFFILLLFTSHFILHSREIGRWGINKNVFLKIFFQLSFSFCYAFLGMMAGMLCVGFGAYLKRKSSEIRV